ncbi:MAG: lysine--tRNA ligase [Armatimonadetes bacterium]|nr:lysine--tRNA ligase [Armatimonadota bacterium]
MWVDLVVEEILREAPSHRHVVNDAKTPSGHIHVGALRGVLLHDCVTRGLRDAGADVEYIYGFDDYDPMDDLPVYLPRDYERYLGVPFCNVPAPEGGGESYARYYAQEFIDVFTRLGATPGVYWTSDLYRSGRFNEAIRIALDRAQEIREIDREIRGSRGLEGRYPLHVICQQCGRIGTTAVVAWDGREVEYECRPDLVRWAQGCGHRGRTAPFDGHAKLPYRVEWAAKWFVLGVTVEGAGKDHFTRGGTHDVASAFCTRIFGARVPHPIPYEFFLYGGKKMSSSRAVGAFARDLAEAMRPELLRFLMVRPHPRKQIDFDPAGDTIPRLYDEYDRAAEAAQGEAEDRDLARTFYFSRVAGDPPRGFRPRFSKVAFLIQMPTVDARRVLERDKGAPYTAEDERELEQRISDARRWLERFALPPARFTLQAELPEAARALTDAQRQFLRRLAEIVQAEAWEGEPLHTRIHELKEEMGLTPREAFGAIYLIVLGKDSGPQAGWFLATLDREFVMRRLREASAAPASAGE